MDQNERDAIEKAKIGKHEERLVGWDHIRQKKLGTNYPPMRAKGVIDPFEQFKGSQQEKTSNGSWFYHLLIIILVVVFIAWIASKIG